jgi:hypothetical protein
MLGRFAWLKVISENRRTIFKLVRQGVQAWWNSRASRQPQPATISGD